MDLLLPVAVPAADPADVRVVLEGLGLAGSLVEGSVLGFPDWVLARVARGEDGALVLRGPEVDVEVLSTHGLAAALAQRWPGAAVGDVEIEGVEPLLPLLLSPDLPARTVAVTPPADLMLGVFARGAQMTLHEARIADQLVVGVAAGHEGPDDVLVDALVNAKGVSVVLWRRGPCLGLHVLRRGRQRQVHVWEPRWTPFGHPDLDELRADLRPVEGDAAEVVELLGLRAEDVVPLRAAMRWTDPRVEAIVELLGLPREAADVVAGRVAVADLPGAHECVPQTFREAMRSSEHDPAWVRGLDRGMRELRPWYVVSCLLFLVLCGWGVARWLDGGSTVWGVVAALAFLGQVVDLLARWRLKRRRSAPPA